MLAITPVGRTLTGLERLDNLRLSMRLLAHAPHRVLVFDEADDIFSRRGALAGASDESTPERGSVSMVNRRASLNRLIETSCIPVLWIMNNAEVLDPAVLRRVDVVIQLEAMPRSAKLSLLKESLLSLPDTAAVQSDSAVSAPAMERD